MCQEPLCTDKRVSPGRAAAGHRSGPQLLGSHPDRCCWDHTPRLQARRLAHPVMRGHSLTQTLPAERIQRGSFCFEAQKPDKQAQRASPDGRITSVGRRRLSSAAARTVTCGSTGMRVPACRSSTSDLRQANRAHPVSGQRRQPRGGGVRGEQVQRQTQQTHSSHALDGYADRLPRCRCHGSQQLLCSTHTASARASANSAQSLRQRTLAQRVHAQHHVVIWVRQHCGNDLLACVQARRECIAARNCSFQQPLLFRAHSRGRQAPPSRPHHGAQ